MSPLISKHIFLTRESGKVVGNDCKHCAISLVCAAESDVVVVADSAYITKNYQKVSAVGM